MSENNRFAPALDSGLKRKRKESDQGHAQNCSDEVTDRNIEPAKKRVRFEEKNITDAMDSKSTQNARGAKNMDINPDNRDMATEKETRDPPSVISGPSTVPRPYISATSTRENETSAIMRPSYVYDTNVEDEIDYSDGDIEDKSWHKPIETTIDDASFRLDKVAPASRRWSSPATGNKDHPVTCDALSATTNVANLSRTDPPTSLLPSLGTYEESMNPGVNMDSSKKKSKAERQADLEAKKIAALESLKRNKGKTETAQQKPKVQYRTVGIQTEPIHNPPLFEYHSCNPENETSLQPVEKVLPQVEAMIDQMMKNDPTCLAKRVAKTKTERAIENWTEENEKQEWTQELLRARCAGSAWEAAFGGKPMEHHIGAAAHGRYDEANGTMVDMNVYTTPNGKAYAKNLSRIETFDDSYREDRTQPAQGHTFNVVTFEPFLFSPKGKKWKNDSAFQTMTAKAKDAAIDKAIEHAKFLVAENEDTIAAAYQGLAFAEVESDRTKIVHSERSPLVIEKLDEDGKITLDISKIRAIEVIAAKKEDDRQVATLPNIKEHRLDEESVPLYAGMSAPMKISVIDISDREHETVYCPTLVTQDDIIPVAHIDWDEIDMESAATRWMRAESWAHMKAEAKRDTSGRLPAQTKPQPGPTIPEPLPNVPKEPKAHHQHPKPQEAEKEMPAQAEHEDARRARDSPAAKQQSPRSSKKRPRDERKEEHKEDDARIQGVANKKQRVNTAQPNQTPRNWHDTTVRKDENTGFSIKGAGAKMVPSQTPENSGKQPEAAPTAEHVLPAFLGGYKIEHNALNSARKDRSTQHDIDLSVDDLRQMRENRNEREGRRPFHRDTGAIDKRDRHQGVPPRGDRYKPGTNAGRSPTGVGDDDFRIRGGHQDDSRDNRRPDYNGYGSRRGGYHSNTPHENLEAHGKGDDQRGEPAGRYHGGRGRGRGRGRGGRGGAPGGSRGRGRGHAYGQQYGHDARRGHAWGHGR